jgi:hypothetical protein
MGVSITTDPQARTLTITVTEADWEKTQKQSFYHGEQAVQQIVMRIGRELVQELLQSKREAAPTLEEEEQRWYRKEASMGHYHTLYGEVAVERPLYQTRAGGDTRCPLEELCQLSFASATPLLAEVLSFKVSAMTPHEVAQDVGKQGLTLSPSFIEQTAQRVGQLAVQKSARWPVSRPESARPVRTIATGLEGTPLPLREEHYKEARCGTLALYDGKGQRLATTYLGAMPESGKGQFTERFTSRVAQVQARYPRARHVVLSDGATWNWQFLTTQYPDAVGILDFWHAAQHLAEAGDAIFGAAPSTEKTAWFERWRTTLRDEPHGVAGVIRTLIYYRNAASLSPAAQRVVATHLHYFRQHAEHMQYATYTAAKLPIGSGVTEAGCKELIKARFCRSGMRWKRDSDDAILQLRALRLSVQWDSFWAKVMRYAA